MVRSVLGFLAFAQICRCKLTLKIPEAQILFGVYIIPFSLVLMRCYQDARTHLSN